MTAPTMDERRAVARRLRGYDCPVLPSQQTTMEAVDAVVECMDLEDDEKMCTVRYFLDRLADLIDPGADTTMSAYDLLPEDGREALDWVREHGGLDEVEAEWGYAHDRTGLANSVAVRLGVDPLTDADISKKVMDELDRRLMPDGCEWPRYESGEPVAFGDEVTKNGEEFGAGAFEVFSDGSYVLNFRAYSKGERVKRPAPKVLDADGVEIEVGDDLYSVEGMLKFHVSAIDKKSGRIATEAMFALDKWADPKMYTHRAPVLAADGKPLEVGQTVYVIANGKTHHVTEVDAVSKRFRSMEQVDGSHWLDPMCFTHQRLVVDADGVPIKVGDTVYFTDGREQECNTVVHAKYDYKDEPYVQLGRLNDVGYPTYTNCSCIDPSQLTHTKPESLDSWERIEEDADATAHLFDAFDADASARIRDLVRRARALAERDAS